jgi:hypothetical protein
VAQGDREDVGERDEQLAMSVMVEDGDERGESALNALLCLASPALFLFHYSASLWYSVPSTALMWS